jgi:hypothetical protein
MTRMAQTLAAALCYHSQATAAITMVSTRLAVKQASHDSIESAAVVVVCPVKACCASRLEEEGIYGMGLLQVAEAAQCRQMKRQVVLVMTLHCSSHRDTSGRQRMLQQQQQLLLTAMLARAAAAVALRAGPRMRGSAAPAQAAAVWAPVAPVLVLVLVLLLRLLLLLLRPARRAG